jgi:predicted transcriptional regulator
MAGMKTSAYAKFLAQAERQRARILSLRAKKPQPTMQTIADAVGLTRQRVQQIIAEENDKAKA